MSLSSTKPLTHTAYVFKMNQSEVFININHQVGMGEWLHDIQALEGGSP